MNGRMRYLYLLLLVGCAHHSFDDDGTGMDSGAPMPDGGSKPFPMLDGGTNGDDGSMTMDGGSPTDSGVVVDAGQKLLGPPCSHGAGFVAWKFHYANNSTSKITDVYSLP